MTKIITMAIHCGLQICTSWVQEINFGIVFNFYFVNMFSSEILRIIIAVIISA